MDWVAAEREAEFKDNQTELGGDVTLRWRTKKSVYEHMYHHTLLIKAYGSAGMI